ncbi:alkaline phosphatase synthesis transcriptional regulatory protein PhoP [bacterium BMS3Abin07]|nr:alkaline phosphatase synthesis transcriptional regulatory protein PhoP [bacterium BMS3Abin07]GBE31319.1 alkaline phosphatase synthesis transcriptional regulatory protein PhoP [bacterium BMS3Bbin05]
MIKSAVEQGSSVRRAAALLLITISDTGRCDGIIKMKKKILIAGHFETFLEMDRNILSRDDCLIFSASSSENALSIHEKESVDLIITDLELTDMDGDELCSYIREHLTLKKVSILILCSKNNSEMERCVVCGANAFITRPLAPGELNRKVGTLLNISERENFRVIMKTSVEGNMDGETFFSLSENISKTGILLRTRKILKEGDNILCTFLLGPEKLTVEGGIARIDKRITDEYLYGVRFFNDDPILAQRIEKFIESRRS